MNLLCPHCQKMLTISEQQEGQQTRCPLCSNVFTVPSLPPLTEQPGPTGPIVLPAGPASVAPSSLPSMEAGISSPAPAPAPTSGNAEVYSLTPAPVPPPPPPPPVPPPVEEVVSPQPVSLAVPVNAPTTPAGHHLALTLSPEAIPWFAPAAATALLILWFFPWLGTYPGGHAVYTQSAFQAMYGGFSTNSVGEKVLKVRGKLDEVISSNPLMIVAFLSMVLCLVIAWLPVAQSRLQLRQPILEPLLARRTLWLATAGVLLLLVLLIQMYLGFGLEKAVRTVATRELEAQRSEATTPEEIQRLEISEGLAVGQYDLRTTWWRTMAFLGLLLLLLGATLEGIVARQGDALPRLQITW